MRQYHVTVFATVDNEGNIVHWSQCEPGAEPMDSSEEAIFNTETEEWESNFDGSDFSRNLPGDKANVWSKVDAEIHEAPERMVPKAQPRQPTTWWYTLTPAPSCGSRRPCVSPVRRIP